MNAASWRVSPEMVVLNRVTLVRFALSTIERLMVLFAIRDVCTVLEMVVVLLMTLPLMVDPLMRLSVMVLLIIVLLSVWDRLTRLNRTVEFDTVELEMMLVFAVA